MTVHIISMNDSIPSGGMEINTTSRSSNWSKGLSPFYVGPVNLYYNSNDELYVAKNLENAWQFSKVYKQHIGPDGNPNDNYFKWAEKGWADTFAHRYPMGRGAIPEYSWWGGGFGHKLDYIQARHTIYLPLYAQAVKKTDAFQKLKELYDAGEDLYLRDFDGYNHRKLGMTYDDVIDDPTRKMGHAFVLGWLLECWIYKGILRGGT